MTLHLTKEIMELIERRVAAAGYRSPQEYVEKLVLDDEIRARSDEAGPPIDEYIDSLPPEKQAKAKKILEQMLLDGLNSGESIVMDEAAWAQKRKALLERIRQKAQSKT